MAEEKENNIIRFIRGYELIASDAESARTYYHYASDEMGSITHLVEGNVVCNCYEYDAWGNTTVCEETVENRFQFNGQQYDAITQQYYLRARFYNPVIARFTQEDTYWGDGLDLYKYCRNNRVYYVDPSGHQPTCVKNNAKMYMEDYGLSKEDAYREAYKEHAQEKLAREDLSAKERDKLERRLKRLGIDVQNTSQNKPKNPTIDLPDSDHRKKSNTEHKENTETKDPDYVKNNRVPKDFETVLNDSEYHRTGRTEKGAQIYKKGDKYYYRDTLHTGKAAHIEVFDKRGRHLGEAYPLTEIIRPDTAD